MLFVCGCSSPASLSPTPRQNTIGLCPILQHLSLLRSWIAWGSHATFQKKSTSGTSRRYRWDCRSTSLRTWASKSCKFYIRAYEETTVDRGSATERRHDVSSNLLCPLPRPLSCKKYRQPRHLPSHAFSIQRPRQKGKQHNSLVSFCLLRAILPRWSTWHKPSRRRRNKGNDRTKPLGNSPPPAPNCRSLINPIRHQSTPLATTRCDIMPPRSWQRRP